MENKKAFNVSITLLDSFILTETEVKFLLDKNENEEINEEDWNNAAKEWVESLIVKKDISNANDIEIEEVWHN